MSRHGTKRKEIYEVLSEIAPGLQTWDLMWENKCGYHILPFLKK